MLRHVSLTITWLQNMDFKVQELNRELQIVRSGWWPVAATASALNSSLFPPLGLISRMAGHGAITIRQSDTDSRPESSLLLYSVRQRGEDSNTRRLIKGCKSWLTPVSTLLQLLPHWQYITQSRETEESM